MPDFILSENSSRFIGRLFGNDFLKSSLLSNRLLIETTQWFKQSVSISTKAVFIETVKFLSSCCVKALNSAVRSTSLKVRLGRNFETTEFVVTELESLQICIKLKYCVEYSRQRLTHWVRVKLASMFSNNRFANLCGLADVNFVNCIFTCKIFWRYSNDIFPKFGKQIFIAFYENTKFCSGITVLTNVAQVR